MKFPFRETANQMQRKITTEKCDESIEYLDEDDQELVLNSVTRAAHSTNQYMQMSLRIISLFLIAGILYWGWIEADRWFHLTLNLIIIIFAKCPPNRLLSITIIVLLTIDFIFLLLPALLNRKLFWMALQIMSFDAATLLYFCACQYAEQSQVDSLKQIEQLSHSKYKYLSL